MVGVVAQASARTIRFNRGARIMVQASWCKNRGASIMVQEPTQSQGRVTPSTDPIREPMQSQPKGRWGHGIRGAIEGCHPGDNIIPGLM